MILHSSALATEVVVRTLMEALGGSSDVMRRGRAPALPIRWSRCLAARVGGAAQRSGPIRMARLQRDAIQEGQSSNGAHDPPRLVAVPTPTRE